MTLKGYLYKCYLCFLLLLYICTDTLLVLYWHPVYFYLVLMLAVNVIIKLSSRIPTDREEERDKMKLGAIWARSVLRIPAARGTEQQMQLAGRAPRQRREGAHLPPSRLSMLSNGVWGHWGGWLGGLTSTVQRETHSCWREAIWVPRRWKTNI